MVPITANILQPLVDVFEGILKFFHDNIGASWGLSIILMTIVVRAALLPVAVKQFRSMQALQRIAPHLKALQERYKDDKQRLQQETMKFYQEHKVNPFASCLPLVAQLPVFLSLFYMLRKDLRHDICPDKNPAHVANPIPCGHSVHSEFWFIHDITDKATGGILITLVILYVGTQLLSSLLTMTATVDKNQRMMMLVMPFIFVPFILRFPAGLMLYWITTNVWTIGQQQFLRRIIGRNQPAPPPLPATSGGSASSKPAAGANGSAAAPTGLFGRLAAASAGDRRPAAEEADDQRVTKAPPPPPKQRKRKRSGRRR